jgi:cytoplasmic tRNA 2-thiolation protein 2
MQGDRYKVKYGEVATKWGRQRVLLAFSGGISSLVLFDVMASLLQEQAIQHKGKQGFELVILALDELETSKLDRSVSDVLPALVRRYDPVEITYKVLSLDTYVVGRAMMEKITIDRQFTGFSHKIDADSGMTINDLLLACPNRSSAEDLLGVVYDELILSTAYHEECQTILYGHSMTRIANDVIALTVKGRGSSIYRAISDRTEEFGGKQFNIIYPLREILFGEILAYGKLAELDENIVKSTVAKSNINKNLTIRELTTNYFSLLDDTGYASTASAVVKTGEKLGAPTTEVVSKCQICGVSIHQDPKKWLSRITVSDPAPVVTEEEQQYLEMYQEQTPSPAVNEEGTKLDICYGCLVTLRGVDLTSGFIWPVKHANDHDAPLKPVYVDSNDKQAILDEYVLTDEE